MTFKNFKEIPCYAKVIEDIFYCPTCVRAKHGRKTPRCLKIHKKTQSLTNIKVKYNIHASIALTNNRVEFKNAKYKM